MNTPISENLYNPGTKSLLSFEIIKILIDAVTYLNIILGNLIYLTLKIAKPDF